MKFKKLRSAFSLTELSVVVLVASAVLVGILSVQTSSNSANKIKVTNDRIGQIYKALKVYAGAHKRLPCPASIAIPKNDATYGSEISCAADTVVYGMLPVKDLNLAAAFAEDDYGNKLVYVIDSTFTVATTPSKFVDQEGDIVVSRYSSSLGVEESNAIFAVISRGKNQRGAVSSLATTEINAPTDVDELENMPSGSDANLISGTNRSGTTFDDLVFFKNKKYFLADANLTTLQDQNLVGCTTGYTRVGGDCVVQCDVPTTIGINSGAKVNQGTNQTLSCNAPNFKTSDSINYSCSSSKVFTNNSGSCGCQAGYSLSGSSCTPTLCSITGVSGFNNKSGLSYVTTATAISAPCQAGYSGTPTYTCTTTGPAIISGSCATITCSITGVTGFNDKTNLAYATSTTAISAPCQAGYSGTPTYTCATTGPAIISGSCAATTCSITGVTGFNDKTNLAYATSTTAISAPCQAGYSGTPTYTCATTGPAIISGSCAAITCSITGVTGFNNKTGLSYAASATVIPTPCQSGYAGSPTYICTANGSATISGSCAVRPYWSVVDTTSAIAFGPNPTPEVTARTATCTSARNGKYLYLTGNATVSGTVLTPTSNYPGAYRLFNCYCVGSSECTTSCGYGGGLSGGTI